MPGLSSDRAFYFRFDAGYAFQDINEFRQADLIEQGGRIVSDHFGDSGVLGAGVGWRLSPWLRIDLTGEYRTSADVEARDRLVVQLDDPAGVMDASTTYKTDYSAIVGLANLYVDLPKIHGITPYIGGGIGFARNKFSGLRAVTGATFIDDDTGTVLEQEVIGVSKSNSETSFAWALMAGLVIDLRENTKLDFGYRYIDLGGDTSVSSGIIACRCDAVGGPLKGADLDAHEIRIGLRWEFDRPAPLPAPLK